MRLRKSRSTPQRSGRSGHRDPSGLRLNDVGSMTCASCETRNVAVQLGRQVFCDPPNYPGLSHTQCRP